MIYLQDCTWVFFVVKTTLVHGTPSQQLFTQIYLNSTPNVDS